MTKRGPHGTLRQVSPLASSAEPATEDPEASGVSDVAEKRRGDEYADQVVQQFRTTQSKTLTAEKKIVIPSREAKTLKVRHEDVPLLAAALERERERARAAGNAARASGLPVREHPDEAPAVPAIGVGEHVESGAGWIEDPDSFDAEVFASEHPPPLASERASSTAPATQSRVGALLLLLAAVLSGGGVAVYVLGPPAWMNAVSGLIEPAVAPVNSPKAAASEDSRERSGQEAATPSRATSPTSPADRAAPSGNSAASGSSAASGEAVASGVSSSASPAPPTTAAPPTSPAPAPRRRAPAPNSEVYPDF